MADSDTDFRATFHSHVLKLRNRDISHVLRILAAHAPAAVVRDDEDVTVEEARVTPAAWAALRAHATSAATAALRPPPLPNGRYPSHTAGIPPRSTRRRTSGCSA